MTETGLYYALSTIAQCAAALAALIGFLGLWQLDRLREQRAEAGQYLRWLMHGGHLNMNPQNAREVMILPTDRLIAEAMSLMAADARGESAERRGELIEKLRHSMDVQALQRWNALPDEQRRLMRVLGVFLAVTLVVILAPAIVGIIYVKELETWAWTPWPLYVASAWLAGAPVWVVLQAARRPSV